MNYHDIMVVVMGYTTAANTRRRKKWKNPPHAKRCLLADYIM